MLADELVVGSDPSCHVALDSRDVAPRHLEARAERGAVSVMLATWRVRTWIDGAEVEPRDWHRVAPGDVVAFGGYALSFRYDDARIERSAHALPGEAPLAQALRAQPRDAATRRVYADWLEQYGAPERAEFLRAQLALEGLSPDDPGTRAAFRAASRRLRRAAQRVDVRFRALAAVPALEKCSLAFELRCPRRWDALTPTDHCGSVFGASRPNTHCANHAGQGRDAAVRGVTRLLFLSA